ncbi:MAG: LysR substrate-binding domain-containing protein, partial [Lutibacter sp.]|nr:LysR substrate-binding domain-containing protein [Lutibacter sp.]
DLDIQDILLLKDGHCFKDSVLNLCNTFEKDIDNRLQLFSGSFDTIIKLSKEGLGMTLLPYLHSLDLEDKDRMYLREFSGTAPAREVSLIFHKSQLKMHLIEALKVSIDRIVKTVIVFNDVNIISPVLKKEV